VASARTTGLLLVQAAVIVAVVLAVHYRVYTIPFLYSETIGLEENAVVTDLDLFRERMLTPRGLLERPLSVLTFALNHRVSGAAAGFHAVNLAIHAVNALLVFALARRFFTAPLMAALVFAVHPLATACVSQIFGRSYSLATTFALLALLAWATWARRGWPRAGQTAIVAALLVLAALTKQSLAAFVLVLVWWEIGRGRRALPRGGAVVATAAVLLVGAVLLVFYAIPLSRTAAIPPDTYLWSQLAHVPTMAGFFLLPYQTALVHDLVLYRDPLDPHVLLGGALAAATLAAVWRWRSHPCGWLVGAIALCLLPTNSILPKNEIVREWRLYPALAFFALLAAETISRAVTALRSRTLRAAASACVAAWLGAFVHTDLLQNHVYQTELDAWRQVLARYPYSSDAMNNVGVWYLERGDVAMARRYFTLATLSEPRIALYHQNLARACTALGDDATARDELVKARHLAPYGERALALHYAGDPEVRRAAQLVD
jgi:hypothetical protein